MPDYLGSLFFAKVNDKMVMRLQFLVLLIIMSNIASAQLDDNFNDGEILHQPEWLGDTADFTVDLSGQLQLNAPDAGTSNLFTPLSLNSMDNIEWTFFIHLAFSPSSTNFARV